MLVLSVSKFVVNRSDDGSLTCPARRATRGEGRATPILGKNGCGPGNGTELLAAAFPSATIVGLDLSDNMLAVARTQVAIAQFVKQDIESWRPVEKVHPCLSRRAECR